ncbi:hypothetical protein EDEG_00912 [Edhazardia aedis USNM 41457]|uniref:HECT-type E3 ubiquitin transferase n=1 Tax=Edhazardia aedis (strain USNM 41457) TaxID=1003232 RepID=J9DQZ2_EDHAE|nr:hypothetical protein EDEG_00912 [Edhazardia aedis USNM 41457]|eukprot:EJW04995.1 hypothetical protein EDEG_00912 [Edhazardia aedis USNM 41457]
MYLILDSTDLCSHGLSSFFKYHEFILCINTGEYEAAVRIKGKKAQVGCTFKREKTVNHFKLKLFKDNEQLECITIVAGLDSVFNVRIKNKYCSGTIRFQYTTCDIFALLDYKFAGLKDWEGLRRLNPVLSKFVHKMNDRFDIRKIYTFDYEEEIKKRNECLKRKEKNINCNESCEYCLPESRNLDFVEVARRHEASSFVRQDVEDLIRISSPSNILNSTLFHNYRNDQRFDLRFTQELLSQILRNTQAEPESEVARLPQTISQSHDSLLIEGLSNLQLLGNQIASLPEFREFPELTEIPAIPDLPQSPRSPVVRRTGNGIVFGFLSDLFFPDEETDSSDQSSAETRSSSSLGYSEQIYRRTVSAPERLKHKYYFVDRGIGQTTFELDKNEFCGELPDGWTEHFTPNGIPYYANHRKCFTQWTHPNSWKVETEMLEKNSKYNKSSDLRKFSKLVTFRRFNMTVDRKMLVQSSAKYLLSSTKSDFSKPMMVSFLNEMGEDYGAISREFFYNCSLELVKDHRIKIVAGLYDIISEAALKSYNKKKARRAKRKLEAKQKKQQEYAEKRARGEKVVEHVVTCRCCNAKPTKKYDNGLCDNDFYKFIGIFLALAVETQSNIAVDFTQGFYENLLKREYTLGHIQDIQTQKNMVSMLGKGNIDAYNDFFERKTTIIKNNRKKKNNPSNTDPENQNTPSGIMDLPYPEDVIMNCDFINDSVNYSLFHHNSNGYNLIRKSFYSIVHKDFADIYDAKSMSSLLVGKEVLTVQHLKDTVTYSKSNPKTREIVFLFEILATKDEAFLRRFLQFVTGTATIQVGSLKGKTFTWIAELTGEKNALFTATSCICKLFIGKFTSKKIMEKCLIYSLDNCEGFHKM